MPLLSANPIVVPTTANAVMYGLIYDPGSDRLAFSNQQYRSNPDGTGAVTIGPMKNTTIPVVVDALLSDSDLAALWSVVQSLMTSFAAAKNLGSPLWFSLIPRIKRPEAPVGAGTVTAALMFKVNDQQVFLTTDVFVDAMADANLAALVIPFQAAIATYAAAKGW